MKIKFILISTITTILISYLIFLVFKPIDISKFDVKDDQINQEYDFIVVGAGQAGCIVASRLAEQDFSVLLIEAGGSDILNPFMNPISIPAFFPLLFQNKIAQWKINANTMEDQEFNSYVHFPIGKIVGGSGSINAQMWNIGSKKIYDLWEEEIGLIGWNFQEAQKTYKKIEQTMHISLQSHYIHDSVQYALDKFQQVFGKLKDNLYDNSGFEYSQNNVKDGRRWSTADAYLKPTLQKKSETFHLKMNRQVTKLIFNKEKNAVEGVEFAENADSKKYVIKAKKEVILCAGTIHSPHILMHSGIGNEEILKKAKISIIKNLKGVGENLKNHYGSQVSFKLKKETNWTSIEHVLSISNIIKYIFNKSGQFSSNLGEIHGILEISSQFPHIPNQGIICGPYLLVNDQQKDSLGKSYPGESSYFSCLPALMLPYSTGNIQVNSNNPFDQPIVNLNYYSDERDVEGMISLYEIITHVLGSEQDKFELMFPPKEETTDKKKFASYLKKNILSHSHVTGTCKMGKSSDELAVVNNKLQVFGFQNLRIIDNSIIPIQPNFATQPIAAMIAERGAEFIIQKYKK